MNSLSTILSAIYVLLMVLVPWLHMPLHAQERETAITAHDFCGHHHSHPEEESETTDECGFCSLAVLPAEVPTILSVPQAIFTISEAPRFLSESSFPSLLQLHQARAPPFMTV